MSRMNAEARMCQEPAENKAIIVGISGCSSSGKTTLSRLLRDIFPGSFILHEDDFYKPDQDIPVTNGLQDWDCVEALDIPALRSALEHIHMHGAPPAHLISKEDQNEIPTNNDDAAASVSASTLSTLRAHVLERLSRLDRRPPRIALLDGFLLYGQSVPSIRDAIDIKLFLRTRTFQDAKRRRENRAGYVTLDGFWRDPPGYVEQIVWPAYVREHAFLFRHGDVEGVYDPEVLDRFEIKAITPDDAAQGDMSSTLRWAVEVLLKELERTQDK